MMNTGSRWSVGLRLIALFAIGGPSTLVSGSVCPPDFAGLKPDPEDCQTYYKCHYGQTYKETCPSGTLFNPDRNYCDWPYNVNCQTGPTESSTTTTTTTTSTSTTGTEPTTTATATTQSCDSIMQVSSSWSGNLGGSLNLVAPAQLASYTIQVVSDIALTSVQFWDADVSQISGTKFTLTPKSWFSGLQKGAELSLGFQISFAGSVKPTFTSVILNGEEQCNGDSGSATTATTTTTTTTEEKVTTTKSTDSSEATEGTTTTTTTETTTTKDSGSCNNLKVVCYFPNWPYYRPGLAQHDEEDIDVELCTHIIYSFAVLDASTYTMKVYDAWRDIDRKGYEKFVALKKTYPNKKFIIAIGGWNDSRTNKYSTMLADPARRANFVTKAVEFIKQYGFDGLDLDYEYPAYQQDASEKQTFAAWVRELKTAFEPHGWELTAAVSAGRSTIDRGYDVVEISKYLDAIHLMTYDIHGHWDFKVNHHAPLYTDDQETAYTSVDYAVNYWMSLGAPASKLVLGIPTYGQSFTLSSAAASSPGSAASGPGLGGPITAQPGFLGYQEICMDSGWQVVEDPQGRRGPYAVKGNQWVGYDDPKMAAIKAAYILEKGLGGAMFWDLPSDDFNARCGGERYPIIAAVNNALGLC